MVLLMILLAVLVVTAVVATIHVTLRDGYRRVPVRATPTLEK